MGNKSSKPKVVDKKEEQNKSTMEFKSTSPKITSISSARTYMRNEQTLQNTVLSRGSITSTSFTSPMRLNSNVQNRIDHVPREIWNPSESLPKRTSSFTRYEERIQFPIEIRNIPTMNNAQKLNYETPSTKPKDPNPSPTLKRNQLSPSDCYHQSYLKTRRPVYIINSYFKGLKEERKGSEKDVERLQKTFKNFTMNCSVKRDPTTKTIKQLAKKYKKKNCANYDFLMFVIMTNGDRNGNLEAKNKSYNINEDFINVILKNSSLENIPKIFIIQACSGYLEEDSVPVKITKMKPADTLKIISTYERSTTIPDIEKGTNFIQIFCDKLEEFGETEDLESIVKRVISACLEQTKKVPEQSTTLRKRVIIGKMERK